MVAFVVWKGQSRFNVKSKIVLFHLMAPHTFERYMDAKCFRGSYFYGNRYDSKLLKVIWWTFLNNQNIEFMLMFGRFCAALELQ